MVAEIDGEPLFRWADAATAALDARIRAGDLVEEAVDDHEVYEHYSNGAELVERFAGSGASPRRSRRASQPSRTFSPCESDAACGGYASAAHAPRSSAAITSSVCHTCPKTRAKPESAAR